MVIPATAMVILGRMGIAVAGSRAAVVVRADLAGFQNLRGLRMTIAAAGTMCPALRRPFHDLNLCLRQAVQLIHQRIDLLIRRVDLALDQVSIRRCFGGSYLTSSRLRSFH
jgi:hypothetical protein